MKQKVINQAKLQTILCIIALTLGVLVSAVLFSMSPVHAEKLQTLSSNSGTYNVHGEYFDAWNNNCSYDYHIVLKNNDLFYAYVREDSY